MSGLKIASLLLTGLFAFTPFAFAEGDVKAKGEKDQAAEKEAAKKKVEAGRLPKDRKPREKAALETSVKASTKKTESIEARIKVQVTAVDKCATDPKAAEECDKLEAGFKELAEALDALEECAFEEEALLLVMAELIEEANELEEIADDLEEIAWALESEELYAAVDVLDDVCFELDLIIYELDQAIDELDGTVGDDDHDSIFIEFEISIEIK